MKIAVIDSSVAGFEHKLNKVLEIITQTLSEFDDVEIEHINLSGLNLPYYNGKDSCIQSIVDSIRAAKGVIFAANAGEFAPNALMMNFAEHLSDKHNNGILQDKNCLIVVTSAYGGERPAAETLSRIIASLNGYDAGRVMVGPQYLPTIQENEDFKSIIERQTEDFYRVIRQNRRFFIPVSSAQTASSFDAKIEPMTEQQIKSLFGEERQTKYNVDDIYEKYSLNTLEPEHENNINELSRLFAKKYVKEGEIGLVPKGERAINIDYASPKPRIKTCKQMTQSLPHFFKPQLANDLDIVFQLAIKGTNDKDNFEAYVVLKNNECEVIDGRSERNDITIMADEKAWLDILTGKNTAQKSFMIGKIKVRGNFVFLAKLDQVFNFSTMLG